MTDPFNPGRRVPAPYAEETEMRYADVEVLVAVNEDGDYAVDRADGKVYGKFDGEIGGYSRRVVRVRLKVPCPAEAVVTAEVPPDGGEVTAAVS